MHPTNRNGSNRFNRECFAVAVAPEIGPGFSPDISNHNKPGLQPLRYALLHANRKLRGYMQQLWNVRAEITVEPQDFASGDTVGFMNIITWADSAGSARMKIEAYLATFNWHIIGVEEAAPIRENFIYDNDEFAEMIERAGINPDAIICGTFHGYKVN